MLVWSLLRFPTYGSGKVGSGSGTILVREKPGPDPGFLMIIQ